MKTLARFVLFNIIFVLLLSSAGLFIYFAYETLGYQLLPNHAKYGERIIRLMIVFVLPVACVCFLWFRFQVDPKKTILGSAIVILVLFSHFIFNIFETRSRDYLYTQLTCRGANSKVVLHGFGFSTCVTTNFPDEGKPCSRPKDCLSTNCVVPLLELKIIETDYFTIDNKGNRFLPELSKIGRCWNDNDKWCGGPWGHIDMRGNLNTSQCD